MNHNHILRGIIICMIVLFVALCVILATPVRADYDGARVTTAKQDALHQAADILRSVGYADDSAEIKALSAAWWKEEENLNIVAKVIQYEADPRWCGWEHSVAVGAVVMNRVASPYFPNTVYGVVTAPGQYLPAYTWGFDNISRLSYEAAKAAIDGDHDVPADAFWQAQFPQGKETWKTFSVDTGYFASTTYICRGIVGVD